MTLPTDGLGKSMNYKLGMGTYCVSTDRLEAPLLLSY